MNTVAPQSGKAEGAEGSRVTLRERGNHRAEDWYTAWAFSQSSRKSRGV